MPVVNVMVVVCFHKCCMVFTVHVRLSVCVPFHYHQYHGKVFCIVNSAVRERTYLYTPPASHEQELVWGIDLEVKLLTVQYTYLQIN